MNVQEIITIDREILGGQPVFKGTRDPVESFFDHLEAGVSLNHFLDDFPAVTRENAVALLNFANTIISSKDILNSNLSFDYSTTFSSLQNMPEL